jgi:hypothetical protein
MKKIIHIARSGHWLLFLLPAFFILHVATENPEVISAIPAFILWVKYVMAGWLIAICLNLYFRNWHKSILMSFALMSFQFFFGAFYDLMQTHFHGFFFSRYRFILAVVAILFLITAWRLKKINTGSGRIFLYLNTLFILLIFSDLVIFYSSKKNNYPSVTETSVLTPPGQAKPDIYLIVADGYPGQQAFQTYFRYNNDRFTDSLRRAGFYVNETATSNYNHTTHSLASMLNLSYLRNTRTNGADIKEVNRCLELVNNSIFTSYLKKNGYQIINHSIFPLNGTDAALNPGFLPTSTTIITRQTFTGRFLKDLVFQLAHIYHYKKLIRYFHSSVIDGNEEMPSKTIAAAADRSQGPRFVYTHLIMPHYPYLRDSSGFETSEFRWKDVRDTSLFIGYLKYTNNQLLSLISNIRQKSAKPPVILLIGDHGYREFNKPEFTPLQFSCLQAVFYPDGNYHSLYNGMSNVNLLRVLLNDQFNQQLPVLKDSSFVLNEKSAYHH